MANNNIEHYIDDFVVRVSGDTTLSELDKALAKSKQESALIAPADISISKLLANNYGNQAVKATLGLSLEHADGTITKTGSKVIKNVSGFDLAKIYIGSFNTLVSIQEAYLRTEKLPEYEISFIYNFEKYPDEFFRKLRNAHLNWDNFFVEARANPYQVTVKLKGDKDLLELRKSKLEHIFSDPDEIKEGAYLGKLYDSSEERLEIYTKLSDLNKFARLLITNYPESKIKLHPLLGRIDVYFAEMSHQLMFRTYKKIEERLSVLSYHAHIYPVTIEGRRLVRQINQHDNDSEIELYKKITRSYDPDQKFNPGLLFEEGLIAN